MAKKNVPVTEETMTAAPGAGTQIGTFLPDSGSAQPAFAYVGDAHWGQGGRYIVVDGQRVPAPPIDLTNPMEATHG